MIGQRVGNHGLHLGGLFESAAKRHPYVSVDLDHDLDTAPELGRSLTVYACANIVAELTSALNRAGVCPGDRVSVFKSSSFDTFLLLCAVSRAGAVPVALSPTLPGPLAIELIRKAGTSWLVSDHEAVRKLNLPKVQSGVRAILTVGKAVPGCIDLRRDPAGNPSRWEPTEPDRIALVTHTSGTTDTPKLVAHTARTLRARYRPQALAFRMIAPHTERVAIHVSFVHSRLVTAIAISLARGCPLTILRDPSPDRVGEEFARRPPGIIEAHPNTLVEWEVLATHPHRPFAQLSLLSSTFDAIHPGTVDRILGASGRRRPMQAQLYGQSEVGPTVGRVTGRRNLTTTDSRCVGFPFPGMTDVRVITRDGHPPSAEHPGHIEVRTDGRAVTYLGEDERFRRQLDGQWWRMGDVGYRTRWGCLHVSDREVDTVPGFGSALEAEDVLLRRLPELLEVVIVPDGDIPVPVVVTRSGDRLDRRAWDEAVTDNPSLAEPIQIRLGDLPRTATAKVQRLALREHLPSLRASSAQTHERPTPEGIDDEGDA